MLPSQNGFKLGKDGSRLTSYLQDPPGPVILEDSGKWYDWSRKFVVKMLWVVAIVSPAL